MATYLIDNNRGNDSNDGITAPWKNLSKIIGVAALPGDEFLLADDSYWYYDLANNITIPVTWTGSRNNPVVIGKYSPVSLHYNTQGPTIEWNRKIKPSEWVYSAPNNAWTFTAPGTVGFYCLLRLANTWSGSLIDAGLPLSSVDGRFHASGSTLYLYAPSNINPTDYYGEVLLSTNNGFFITSSGRGFVRYEDLYFKNMSTGVLGFSSTAADTGVTILRCKGDTVSALFRGATSGTLGQLYFKVQECEIKNWGSVVVDLFTASSEGFKELVVEKNKFLDGGHLYSQGAVYTKVTSTGLVGHIRDNYINTARYGTRDKTSDGCGIYCEVGANNIWVYRNVLENCHLALQDNSGRSNKFFSNLALNCFSLLKVTDQNGIGALNIEVNNNTLIHNSNIRATFGFGTPDCGIRLFVEAGTINSVTINNNIIYKPNNQAAETAGILTARITPAVSDYSNNAVYNYQYVARREFSPFTVETTPNSITTNPLINFNGSLQNNSPAIGAGVFNDYFRDVLRKQFYNPPSIGAIEYERPRISRN